MLLWRLGWAVGVGLQGGHHAQPYADLLGLWVVNVQVQQVQAQVRGAGGLDSGGRWGYPAQVLMQALLHELGGGLAPAGAAIGVLDVGVRVQQSIVHGAAVEQLGAGGGVLQGAYV